MVTSVTRGWIQEGEGPLLQRWQQAGERLTRLGGQVIAPCSEIAVIEMNETIRRIEREKTPIWDEALARASGEFSTTVERYQTLYKEIVENQKTLGRKRDDPTYQLLGLVRTELLTSPEHPQDMLNRLGKCVIDDPYPSPYRVYLPRFTDAVGFHKANKFVLDRIFTLEVQQAAVIKAMQFASREPIDQMFAITNAIIRHIERSKRLHAQILAEMREQIKAVNMKVDRIGKHLIIRSKRSKL
jgi:hypothetical protein